jgi:hypothetical protein
MQQHEVREMTFQGWFRVHLAARWRRKTAARLAAAAAAVLYWTGKILPERFQVEIFILGLAVSLIFSPFHRFEAAVAAAPQASLFIFVGLIFSVKLP